MPQRLIDRVKAGESSPFFGHVLAVAGGGLRGLRSPVFGLRLSGGRKSPIGHPIDVQYSLMGHILTRVEFLRGEPAIPIHMAHFDPITGQKFSTMIDCY